MAVLSGQVALVTGAAQGIGEAVARMFAEEGARVVLCDRNPDVGRVAESIAAGARSLSLDVSQEDSWTAAIRDIDGCEGRLDCLVNVAGIATRGRIPDTAMSDFDAMVAVNQVGSFLALKVGGAAMRRYGNGGAIVLVGSTGAITPRADLAAYASTKWAVRGLMRAAAAEYGRNNIRVNAVHPGPIDTPLLRINPPEVNERMVASRPIARMGKPEEIAHACLYFCDPRAGYTTGTELVVDGGANAGIG